jgi:hypothetical protein
MREWSCVIALLLCGCNDAAGPTAQQDFSTAADFSSPGGDLASATYPVGPYGHAVGSVIPPLAWEGYADPLADELASNKPYGNYSMNDLRLSGRPYAAIHVAEFL